MNLYKFLLAALLDLFSHELDKVIPSGKSLTKQQFCSIYIQALLDKIVAEVLKANFSWTWNFGRSGLSEGSNRAFHGNRRSKRMEGLKSLPSFTFSLQAFEAHELAKLLQFLCGIFKEDIEILMNELSINYENTFWLQKNWEQLVLTTCEHLTTM